MRTLENIYKVISRLSLEENATDYYIESYSFYIGYFALKKELDKQDVVIGLGLVYSWMPTIPKNVNFTVLDEVLPLLNKVKEGYSLQESEYKVLKKFCNNSLVASTKLLHFINPQCYAIWDSRIYSFIYQDQVPYKYKVENIMKYLDYLRLLNQIVSCPNFDSIIKNVEAYYNYPVSKFRAIEWIIFQSTRKLN